MHGRLNAAKNAKTISIWENKKPFANQLQRAFII
jgi:hypothetical protein